MPDEIVFLVFTSTVAVTSIAFGMMRSINKHLDRKWRAQQGGPGYEPILAELEERVDLTERILAEGNRPDELRASSP